MPFRTLKLHPSLLAGLKELGYARPTPIQAEAIPPAMAGKDVLASAMTGSGKTVAFLLPILHSLIARPRGTTRALVMVPTRELAAQVLENLNELGVHTPISAAAVYGGVALRPQEHAFRSGVDVLIATPGRLLEHMRAPYGKLGGLEHLVIDEADRMLDMGFLPDIRRVLRHLPARRQTLFFSATMPSAIVALTREMLHDPVTINIQRQSAPAVGITQAVYPVAQDLKSLLLLTLLRRGDMQQALVFTRTKHRANRVYEYLARNGIHAERIHGNRSQSQRTEALSGFKSGRHRVLVATDIAARGIDVEELGHVVNFDVPLVPNDYIHRVGRTGRAEATGEAFTFVSAQEEPELQAIERAVGKRLPRVTVPDFDYAARPTERLEVPIAQRLAEMRSRKGAERGRSQTKRGGPSREPHKRGSSSQGGSGRGGSPHGGSSRGTPSRGGQPRAGGSRPAPASPGSKPAPAGGGSERTSRPGNKGRRNTGFGRGGRSSGR